MRGEKEPLDIHKWGTSMNYVRDEGLLIDAQESSVNTYILRGTGLSCDGSRTRRPLSYSPDLFSLSLSPSPPPSPPPPPPPPLSTTTTRPPPGSRAAQPAAHVPD
ncbi:hypothetical protein PV325_012767 [Microctonus aethiopoides]|nr:hypothetical protein PV325_012767 [Microctonus aethiopoides]